MYNLGLISYRRYQKTTKTVLILLILSSAIWLVFSALSQGGVTLVETLVDQRAETRTIDISYGYFNNQDYIRNDLGASDFNYLNKLNGIESIYTRYELYGNQNYVELNNHTVYLNETLYASMASYEQFNYDMLNREGVNEILLAGDKLSDDGVIISELMLLYAGIFDYDDVIGQNITLYIDQELFNVKVDGVYSAYLGDSYFDESLRQTLIDEKGIDNQMLLHPIILGYDLAKNISEDMDIDLYQREVSIVANSIYDVEKLSNDISNFLPNELHSDMAQILSMIETIDQFRNVVGFLLVIVLLQCALILISAIFTKISNQKKYLTLMITLGYKKKDIFFQYMFDYAQVLIRALILGTIIAFFITLGIDLTMRDFYLVYTSNHSFMFMIDYHQYIKFILISSLSYLMLVSIFIYVFIRKNRGE